MFFVALGLMYTNVLQVSFVKFLISFQETIQIFGFDTRTNHLRIRSFTTNEIFEINESTIQSGASDG
jgi:hypothetical protein